MSSIPILSILLRRSWLESGLLNLPYITGGLQSKLLIEVIGLQLAESQWQCMLVMVAVFQAQLAMAQAMASAHSAVRTSYPSSMQIPWTVCAAWTHTTMEFGLLQFLTKTAKHPRAWSTHVHWNNTHIFFCPGFELSSNLVHHIMQVAQLVQAKPRSWFSALSLNPRNDPSEQRKTRKCQDMRRYFFGLSKYRSQENDERIRHCINMANHRYRQCKHAVHFSDTRRMKAEDMIWHDMLKQCMTCAMQDHIKITEHLLSFTSLHLCIELYNTRNTTWKRLSFSTRRRRVLALERRSRRLRDGKKGGLDLSKAVKDTFLHWPIWPIVGRCFVTGTWWSEHNQVFLLESTQILHLASFIWILFTLNSFIFMNSILLATNRKLSS